MPGPAFRDFTRAIGAPEDPAATDTTSSWSLISLFKAIYGTIADGTLVSTIVGQASAHAAFCAGAVAQCAHYMRLTRASRVAAATSATNAATSETNAAGSSILAVQAQVFVAGTAMFGQRAKKDRVAAAASATAAAASAASITSESMVMGVQVYM